MKSFKSIGIEVELFITRQIPGKLQIFNADKIFTEKFGFSIDGSLNSQGNDAYIKKFDGFKVKSDGTPVEYTKHITNLIDDDRLSRHFSKNISLENFLNNFLGDVERFNKSFFKDYNILWDCYFESGNSVEFVDPGSVFSSQKTIYNAYTGLSRIQEKKESNNKVTCRTAGLHLHFEFVNDNFLSKKNEIVKALDNIYKQYYSSVSRKVIVREQKFQQMGDFRIKYHPKDLITLEYRQLTPNFLKEGSLYSFICHADNIIYPLINS